MQFGIFSVSDITRNPVTGYTPSEAERIDAIVQIAKRADEVGLDVFAIGEHHNPPFFSSSPTTLLAHIAAQTERIVLSTAVTLITTNDPVKIAEDYAMLQHLAKGRMDLMLGRGNTVPVYPWFGQDIHKGARARAGELQPAAPAVARGRRGLGGQLPHGAAGLHRRSRGRWTTCRRSSGTARSARRRSPSRPPTTATATSPTTSSRRTSTSSRSSTSTASASRTTATARRSRRSSASAARRSSRKRLAGRGATVPPVLRGLADLRQSLPARGLHARHAAERRQPAGSDREDAHASSEGFGDYQRQLWVVDALGPAARGGAGAGRAARHRGRADAAQGDGVAPGARACRTRRRTRAGCARSTATPSRASRARTRTAATT